MRVKEISFTDLASQHALIRDKVNAALEGVFAHGQYILGPEVLQLEHSLAKFCGAKYAVSCANGTDAIMLVLMAQDLQPQDCVIVPTFTFTATAEAVAKVGGQVVFADVSKDTFNLDIESLVAAIKNAQAAGLKPRGVIAVDLFGQPADYDEILNVAGQYGMFVISDAAQSFGASYKGRRVGTFGLATTTSFFPSKPLGCYGDGGCIFTDDEQLASKLKSLRVHGQGASKYDTVHIGINSRLDTMQAAILLQKMTVFSDEIIKRQQVADTYDEILRGLAVTPVIKSGLQSVWAQYTLTLKSAEQRDSVQFKLKEAGIPTMIYYPKPIHKQLPYQHYLTANETLANSDYLASVVLSLPMSPYLKFSDDYIRHLVSAFEF